MEPKLRFESSNSRLMLMVALIALTLPFCHLVFGQRARPSPSNSPVQPAKQPTD